MERSLDLRLVGTEEAGDRRSQRRRRSVGRRGEGADGGTVLYGELDWFHSSIIAIKLENGVFFYH